MAVADQAPSLSLVAPCETQTPRRCNSEPIAPSSTSGLPVARCSRNPNLGTSPSSFLQCDSLFPHLLGHAQEILAKNAPNVLFAVLAIEQGLGQARRVLGRDVAGAAVGVLALGPIVAVADERLVCLVSVQHAVHAESDVIGADELNHVVYVFHQMLDCMAVRPEEAADAGDADHAAGRSAGLDLIVPDIPLMIPNLARVGVAEYDRPLGCLDRFHGRLVGAMGAIDDHADAIHFGH